jgi:hypothetical protein
MPKNQVFTTEIKSISCFVKRVVPGKLVYVSPQRDPEKSFAFKLDHVLIRKPDGSTDPYRGEPLAKLGVSTGTTAVCNLDAQGKPDTLIVDPEANTSGLRSTIIGSTISSVASTLGYVKKLGD